MVVLFVFAVILATYYLVVSPDFDNPFIGVAAKHHFEFMVLLAFGGIAVGALAFYLSAQEISEQKRITKQNTRVLLDLLDSDEKKVVEALLNEGGAARQYELAWAGGLTKLRAHRAIRKLSGKQVVEVQKMGKVNKIVLNKGILDGLN